MSEEAPVEKKVIHRLEPKKRPVLLAKKPEKREELAQLPRTINAQFFQESADGQEVIEAEWGSPESLAKGRWWLIGGLTLIGAFFAACAIWATAILSQVEKPIGNVKDATSQEVSFEDALKLRHQTVEKYLAATTVAEKALYVRDAERVLPLMEKYYAQVPLVAEKVRANIVEVPVIGKEEVLWRVAARESHSRGAAQILVETFSDGRSLVDWETDVVYQPADWTRFVETRDPTAKLFRVNIQVAQLDGFHGYEFAEYNKYRCFKVTLPGSDSYLWAYTEFDSPEDKRIMSLMTAGGRRAENTKKVLPVMVELSFPENSQSSQCVHFVRLVQAGWLY